MDIFNIKGIGPKTIECLNKLNLNTIQDIIEYYPYRYNIIKVSNIKDINDQETCTIKGIVDLEPRVSFINKKFNRMTFRINSDGILINVTIFNRDNVKCNFVAGEHGEIEGTDYFSLPYGTILTNENIPIVKAKRGYKFIGWDITPIDYTLNDDATFTAQYEKNSPWYSFIFNKGCWLKLLWAQSR